VKRTLARNEKETPFGSLNGRTAVVTGASSGIGREIAIEFARAGADLVIHCRESLQAAESVAAEVHAMGSRAFVLQQDLAEPGGLEAFVESAWTELGAVDVWVNNAGVDILTGSGSGLGFDEKLAALLAVDVRATMLLSRLAGRRMRDAGGGVILNIGWDQSDRGMEGDSGELFSATKNAVMGFTRSLSLSLAPRVRVNCIAPGWIRTAWGETASDAWQRRVMDETPLKRWGEPADIAKLARFLASDDASYITGQVINANGGAVR
jgi:3-oxoacyl-[acyl-carrier protein] reductase